MRPLRPDAVRARPSLLDRLLDANPDQERDDPRASRDSVADMRRAVHRDLEALLNARRTWRPLGAHRPELRVSPMGYGLSDVTAGVLNQARHRESIRHEIELLIRRFEPRLAEVRVTLLRDNAPLEATLPLAIDALLLVEPEPEPIRFGTVVDPMSANLMLQSLQGE